MPKQLSDDDKLRVLGEALQVDDIRLLLATEKIKRRRLASLAGESLEIGLITPEELEKIKQTIERPKCFPTDPEQRISAILSGIVNTEPKQILTLLLRNDSQSLECLRATFVEATSGVWKPKGLGRYIEGYILDSLDPIGFVGHRIMENLGIGFRSTETGERYGRPIAAYVLSLGSQLDFSFYQLLGSTSSNGDSRSPYNRFKILEMLLRSDRRITDLETDLNLDGSGIVDHLKHLRTLGFVDFDSVSVEEAGWAVYRWKDDRRPQEVQTVGRRRRLTPDVAEWMFKNKKGDYNQIACDFERREEYGDRKVVNLRHDIGLVLAGLREQGFLDSAYHARKEQSHVKIVEGRRSFVKDFTTNVRGALQDGTELGYMEGISRDYRTDHAKLIQDSTTRLHTYLKVSPHINTTSSEEWKKRIVAYISSMGEVRPRDMVRDVGCVPEYLSKLVEQRVLKKEKRGGATFYSVNTQL